MDQFLSPQFWKSQLAVVASAPWITVCLLAGIAAFVWWLRGTIAKGQIEGLRAQHEALKAHLVYAQEKERDLKADLAVALTRALMAQESVTLFVKDDSKLATVQLSIESSVAAIEQANSRTDALNSVLVLSRHHWGKEPLDEYRRRLRKAFSEFNLQVTKRSND